MADFPLSPWHMWGTTQLLTLNGVALVSSSNQSEQLARVNYARPITWTFLFFLQLEAISAPSPVAIACDFQLVIGVGRASISVKTGSTPFARLEIPAAELLPGTNPFRMATAIQLPLAQIDDVAPNILDKFPAQDINCNATLFSEGSIGAGVTANFTVGAFFSPVDHIRPEWYSDFQGNRFRGNENGGM